jgi:hypothetical protein
MQSLVADRKPENYPERDQQIPFRDLREIVAGDADGAGREIVAGITEAAHYLAGLADSTGQLRHPPG